VNYCIHTDAIKERLIPSVLTPKDSPSLQDRSPARGNHQRIACAQHFTRRDHATLEQLVVLSNLESLNSVFIRQGTCQAERLQQLNEIAINQMTSLLNHKKIQKLTDSQ